MADGTRTAVRRVFPPRSWRATNLALFAVLGLAFATGLGAVASGSGRGAWVVVAHGVVGIAVVLLLPAKSRVAARGLRRSRPSRGASVALAVLVVGSLVFGFASATGVLRDVAGQTALWVHIALALLLVLPLGWHVVMRPVRPRRADLTRRALVGAGVLAVVGGGLYAGAEGVGRLVGGTGAGRRFTGSYALDPVSTPVTSWLDDAVPSVDPARWRLGVTDADGRRVLSGGELDALGTATVRATLDCTSGWCVTADWTGVPLTRLLGAVGPEHRSVRVRSLTGYDRWFPLSDLDHLLLATGFDGRPLRAGHGFPARLVAPGRRGFWWVKWVDEVELSRRPWWTQPPFPLT
jgi:DMSO/TMAO reductase YedYZ molybdopterin-dependent catalytic subunit